MFMKLLYYFLIFWFLCIGNCFAQTDELRGVVTDERGIPIIGASVVIEGTSKGASTDERGGYHIHRIPKGKQTVIFSYIGYQTEIRHIDFASHRGRRYVSHMHLDVVLKEEQTTLQEVEVVGRKESSYKNTQSFSGTKTAVAIKDIPQSIGYVTKELALDQGASTVNDVVKNISGVTQYSFYNDFSIRGFRVQGNRNSGNLVNGMRAQTSFWKQQPIANMERVEVIKGPASALFGNASPGGVINRVTKKPLRENRRSVSATIGSFGTMKTYADFTGPLDEEKTLLYRLNFGYESTDTFRDLQYNENIILAPSFSFFPNSKTQFNIDFVYQNSDGKLDRGQAVFGDQGLYSVPISQSINAANDYLKEITKNATLSFTHRFTENLSFNGIFMYSSYDEDLMEHRSANTYVRLGDGSYDTEKVAMQMFIRKRSFRNNSFNVFLNYDFSVNKIKNKALLGYDYFQGELLAGGSQLRANAYLLNDGTATNTFNPQRSHLYVLDASGNPMPNVPFFDLTNSASNSVKDYSKYVFTTNIYNPYLQQSHGIYLQNQIEIGFAKILLGIRKEFFIDKMNYKSSSETKTQQQALLPRIGIVFSLSPTINLYSTWLKGYQPQDATTQSDPNAGGPFRPIESQLYETGLKTDWFNNRLSATLSVFRLTQTGTLYNANDPNNAELMLQIGKELSTGFEIDINGQIHQNWSISASYGYNDARITETLTTTEYNIQKPNTPLHSGNIWTKYIINNGVLKNVGIGTGFHFITKRNGIFRSTFPTQFPGYHIVDAALYYRVKNIQVQMNFNNIFNKIHWSGGYDLIRAFPGNPRNVNITVSYHF